MQTRHMVIANPHGLHLRVAARIVQLVQRYKARVRLFGADNREADARSVLGLISLGAGRGEQVRVEADGPGEQQVADALHELFSDGSGI